MLLFPTKRYSIVYLDCPWLYYGDAQKDQAAGKHYTCMPLKDIAALPIRSLLLPQNAVYSWATGPKLAEAIWCMQQWGIYYRTIAFNWVKCTKSGKIIHGQGVRASFTKQTTELLLVGSTQLTGRPLPILDEAMGQVIWDGEGGIPEKAPRGAHSEKPTLFRDRIVQLHGDLPRIELFCRHKPVGWDAWGNQVGLLSGG